MALFKYQLCVHRSDLVQYVFKYIEAKQLDKDKTDALKLKLFTYLKHKSALCYKTSNEESNNTEVVAFVNSIYDTDSLDKERLLIIL